MNDNFYEHLFGVRDKIALVTGGTRGIGYMIAEGLVKAGAKTYVASRKKDACEQTESALTRHGFCKAIPCDLRDVDGCNKLATDFVAEESQLHILVNNAGLTWSMNIDDFSEKAWDRVVDLDAKSPFFLIQALLPALRETATPESRSSIVNITSVNGLKAGGLRNYSYVVAKAGLGQLSAQLARDLMNDNINVNAIAPGPFKSSMTAPLFATSEMEAQVRAGFPMKRWGSMEDIAGLTIFLSSRAGSYITGMTIPCDGGSTTTT